MPKSFIVKVQLSLSTTEPQQQVYIYDKGRKHVYQGDAGEEILTIMGDRTKDFFRAHIVGSQISIDKRVRWRDW